MSDSNNSRGSRLGKFKMLRAKAKTFYDYEAVSDDLTLAQLDALIDSIETQDADVAGKFAVYTNAVNIRQKGFKDDPDSLTETAGNVSSTVSACKDISAKEAKTVHAMYVTIRGEGNTSKKKPPASPENPANADPSEPQLPDPKSISRSERTHGNMVKKFDDILSTLRSFSARYTGTKELSLATLQEKSTLFHAMNAKADEAQVELQLSRSSKDKGTLQMASVFKRTVKGVKGQYGRKSPQYLSVKEIKW